MVGLSGDFLVLRQGGGFYGFTFGGSLPAVSGGGGLDGDDGRQLPFGEPGGEAQVSV